MIPSSLQRLHLDFSWDTSDTQIDELLVHLPDSAPVLRTMYIHIGWNGERRPFPASLIARITSLRHLGIHEMARITPEEMRALLSLPRLETMHCRVEDFQTASSCHDPIEISHSLTRLYLVGTCDDLASLVALFSSSKIYHLTLEVDDKPAVHSLRMNTHCDPSRTLASKASCFPNLRSLRLNCSCRRAWDDTTHNNVAIGMLRPLFGHLYLHYVAVDVAGSADWTDDDILKIAQAWPQLRSLALGNGYNQNTPSALPTAIALQHLATNCPDLIFLRVNLDYTAFKSWQSAAWPELPSLPHGLRKLEFTYLHNSQPLDEESTCTAPLSVRTLTSSPPAEAVELVEIMR